MSLRYRARLPAYCKTHDKDFIRFDGPYGKHSYGCPDCVGKIKADTRKVRASQRLGKRKQRPMCGTFATGKKRPG